MLSDDARDAAAISHIKRENLETVYNQVTL